MSERQYWIEATARCATHPKGTVLCYTGPKSGVAKGWRIVAPVAPQPHIRNGQWTYGGR